jgi:DNA helicase HerA-like ATPase
MTHLLFDNAPKALLDKVEQVARLIRSKGVGVYFVTQSPLDIPDIILGQLGNKVQHALRAYTPRDQKAVRAAAETFRTNPALDAEKPFRSSASARRSYRSSTGGSPTS